MCDQEDEFLFSNNIHSPSHLFIKLPVTLPTAHWSLSSLPLYFFDLVIEFLFRRGTTENAM